MTVTCNARARLIIIYFYSSSCSRRLWTEKSFLADVASTTLTTHSTFNDCSLCSSRFTFHFFYENETLGSRERKRFLVNGSARISARGGRDLLIVTERTPQLFNQRKLDADSNEASFKAHLIKKKILFIVINFVAKFCIYVNWFHDWMQ